MPTQNSNELNTEDKARAEVCADLNKRLLEAGYADVTDFWRRSDIQISHETVRRALHGGKPVSVESFIKIGAHLGLSNVELAEMAQGLGDTFWPERLGNTKWSKRDKAVLAAINRLGAANPEYWNHLQACWKIMAKAVGINIDKHLDELNYSTEKDKEKI